jgi:hypothetical protein
MSERSKNHECYFSDVFRFRWDSVSEYHSVDWNDLPIAIKYYFAYEWPMISISE